MSFSRTVSQGYCDDICDIMGYIYVELPDQRNSAFLSSSKVKSQKQTPQLLSYSMSLPLIFLYNNFCGHISAFFMVRIEKMSQKVLFWLSTTKITKND